MDIHDPGMGQRMNLRFKWVLKGNHIHVRVFSGPDGAGVNHGEIVFSRAEWAWLSMNGAFGPNVELVNEEAPWELKPAPIDPVAMPDSEDPDACFYCRRLNCVCDDSDLRLED